MSNTSTYECICRCAMWSKGASKSGSLIVDMDRRATKLQRMEDVCPTSRTSSMRRPRVKTGRIPAVLSCHLSHLSPSHYSWLDKPCRKVVSKVRRHKLYTPRSGVCTCISPPIAKNIFGSGHACAIYAESTTGTLLAKGLRGCHSPITTGYLRPTKKNPASPQHWRNLAMAKLEKQNSKARFIHIVLK